MKKIMFNDKYSLTQAVLDGRKTMTRRIIKCPRTFRGEWVAGFNIHIRHSDKKIVDWPCMYDADEREFDMGEILPKYELGEVVAIAQSYMDVDRFYRKGKNAAYLEYLDSILPELKLYPGWTNKMFVRADLMPHHIRFTVNKNFVEPKFWGLHEENEQAQCVVIIHDGNALFFYPEDMDNDTHILLDWEKEQTGKIYPTTEEGMKDTDGIGYTKALAASGSEIAEKVIALDLCGLSWRIPTLQESVLGHKHKAMLNAALAICGKQPVKDDWYWCSTRKGNKRNFILSWGDGFRYDNIQDSDDWVRPVSAASLNSL